MRRDPPSLRATMAVLFLLLASPHLGLGSMPEQRMDQPAHLVLEASGGLLKDCEDLRDNDLCSDQQLQSATVCPVSCCEESGYIPCASTGVAEQVKFHGIAACALTVSE